MFNEQFGKQPENAIAEALHAVPADVPVLIAGPTASGKSALALEIAAQQGGVIVNADASQVYDCWRIVTARPSAEEERAAPHLLYGHVSATDPYSTGHWLREVAQVLKGDQRPIITGGTGLYFSALLDGLADIPATPPEVRLRGDQMSLCDLLALTDAETKARVDTQNRARVQRAWEVQETTGRGLAQWQDETGPPLLARSACHAIVFDVEKEWLNNRIALRVDQMLEAGVLDEIAAQRAVYDPSLPAHRAIGVPELMAHLKGEMSLDDAREAMIIATRQFAKRQRTWMRRRMADWQNISLP